MDNPCLVFCTAPVEKVTASVEILLANHPANELIYVGPETSPFNNGSGLRFISWGSGLFTWASIFRLWFRIRSLQPQRTLLPFNNSDGKGYFALRVFSLLVTAGLVFETPIGARARHLKLKDLLPRWNVEEFFHSGFIFLLDLLYPFFIFWLKPKTIRPGSENRTPMQPLLLQENRPAEIPTASIIIRTYNEEKFLGKTLDMISRQRGISREVIVIDSGSTDATVEIACAHPVTVYSISKQSFHYAAALNLGAKLAKGKYIVNLSAHAVPLTQTWLGNLIEPMQKDPGVAGVYGKETPMKNWASPFEKKILSDMFRDELIIRKDSFLFSNANAAMPRELLLEVPFDESADWGEDQVWMHSVQGHGYKSVYQSESAVYHSHNLSMRQSFARCLKFHRALFQTFLKDKADQIRSHFRGSLPRRSVSFHRFLTERRLMNPFAALFYAPVCEYINYLGCEVAWREWEKTPRENKLAYYQKRLTHKAKPEPQEEAVAL